MISRLLPQLPVVPMPVDLRALPGKLIPVSVHSRSLTLALNRILSQALQEDELSFLDGRILQILVSDLNLDYRLTLIGGKFAAAKAHIQPDVRFAGDTKEFMLLGLNKEDPDTLFFQRRLQLEGDTELGLEIKNFLYTLDEDFLPKPLQQIALKILAFL